MMRCVLALLFWLAVGVCAYAAPKDSEPAPQLKSIYCGVHDLSEFRKPDTRAFVLVFVTTICPVAQRYMPTLRQLDVDFASRGVQVLAIYCGSRIDVLAMAEHAQQQDLPFPVLLDTGQRLARQLDVRVTPEAVVLNRDLVKRYQGAIDNQFTVRGQLRDPTRQYVREALARILDEQPIDLDHVTATGCPIETLPPLGTNNKVTFHRDVAPILQRRCQACHRSGGVGPFELVTYEDVYYNSEKIREVVLDRRMPPWHGVLNPKFGELANDGRLSDSEIRTIVGWVRQGSPEGKPSDAPPPVRWPRVDEWAIEKPDYVYKLPQPFRVPKSGVLDYQYFRVKLNLDQDRWIQAVEVRPGNTEVVHHIGLHLVEASDEKYVGIAGMMKLYGFSTDQARLLNDYVPGDSYNAKTYPPGQAVRIPKNSDLIYEIHYTPNNRAAAMDQSMVAFRWADKPARDEVYTQVFRKPIGRFRIPAFASHHKMEDSYYFEHDVLIDAIRPHFHRRAKSFRLEMITRNEETGEIDERVTVLSVPVWDPNWQRTYELKQPLRVPAGVELLATGWWDNSWLNPNNPDPAAVVEWGQQTSDEMFSTRFKYRLAPRQPKP